MSGAYDDTDDHAVEGVEAFNRLTSAIEGLGTRLTALEAGLGQKVRTAEQAAVSAETAAHNAQQTAEYAAATAQASARNLAAGAALGALAGVLAAGGAGYWIGRTSGWEIGKSEGYQAAQDQKAAANWANTRAGQLAFALDQVDSLNMVARCTGQGWIVQTVQGRRMCYPRALKDGSLYGWVLP